MGRVEPHANGNAKSDADEPRFDGDDVPRRLEFSEQLYRRIYTRLPAFRKWQREFSAEVGGWLKTKSTRGDRGWHALRDMIRQLVEIPIQTMLDNPHVYYHFKRLEREREGHYSMRYDNRIRLECEFYCDVDGSPVVEVIKLSDHYDE